MDNLRRMDTAPTVAYIQYTPKGQPPYNGEDACPHCAHCSEAPLYSHHYTPTILRLGLMVYCNTIGIETGNYIVCFSYIIMPCMYYSCFDEKEGRKKEVSKVKQGKATQHAQGSHFSKKNELPHVGLEPTTLHTLDRALYH